MNNLNPQKLARELTIEKKITLISRAYIKFLITIPLQTPIYTPLILQLIDEYLLLILLLFHQLRLD